MSLLALLVAVAALAATLPLAARRLDRGAGLVGAAGLGVATIAVAVQAPAAFGPEPPAWSVAWLPTIGLDLALRLDPLGWLFAIIVLGIGTAVLAYAARYLHHGAPGTARLLGLLTGFAGAMLGLVLADDVVLAVVFWELTSVASFLLIGGKGEGGRGATHALLVTAVGGLALLTAAILVSLAAGTSSLSAILAEPTLVRDAGTAPAIIVLLVLAAATKSAQLPFQFWLPGAMVAPTPISTYLHAATMVKAGVYLLLRFSPVFAGVPLWRTSLVVLGLATAVFGSVTALKQHDLKALLAASTVSQLGLLTALIGVGTPLALAAAALHTLAHALFKATLFMVVGVVDHATGTRDLRELGGLGRALPGVTVTAALAALSMAGIAPLLGFVSKEEALSAVLAVGQPRWLAVAATAALVVASVGTVAYSARLVLGVFAGPARAPRHVPERGLIGPPMVLAGAGLLGGLAVPLLDPVVAAVTRAVSTTDPALQLALWHGLTPALVTSLAVVAAGAGLVVLRHPVQTLQDRVRLPRGADVFDTLYHGLIDLGRVVGRPTRSLAPAAHLLPVLAATLALAGAAALGGGLGVSGSGAPSQAADWPVVVLLAACIVVTAQARSRLTAVAALGMAGFLVAGWFVLLGAPDLALTQLLVETLTVAVVVVVFRRLPDRFPRAGWHRQTVAVTAAVLVGVAAGAATWVLTGRRELSTIGARFLAEGESVTGGGNVVNTILVDLRAIDTLGELTVLGVAALGIYALVRLVRHDPIPRPEPTIEDEPTLTHELFAGPLADPDTARVRVRLWAGPGSIDSLVLQTLANGLGTVMVAASLWLLVRGHDAVGGGFIGGLTAGAAVVLFYLSHGHEQVWQSRWLRVAPLVGTGVLVAVVYGLWGLGVGDGFLAGGQLHLGPVHVAASLVFDVGVYLVVVGLVVSIVRHLGQGLPEDTAVTASQVPS